MAYQNFETVIAQHPLPPLAAAVFSLGILILKWEQHRKTRRALKQLDTRLLDDIGLSQADVQNELEKPFWRG